MSPLSSHVSAQSAPPVHGSPACTEQFPPLHVSVPLQNTLSSHDALLFGCVQEPLDAELLIQPKRPRHHPETSGVREHREDHPPE